MAKQRQTIVNIVYNVNDADIAKSNALLGKASKATDNFQKSLDKTKQSSDSAGKSFKNAGDEGSKAFGSLSNVLKTISFAIIANQILSFTKQVIAVRGEFQKFEAVLTNTLGSKSAALIALGRINEFAKSTPFSVRELTESFIKLANRGVTPTINQMRAIGDLSATLGKDFSQVVEAILDINNPERWKEIGVKAETAGNKVKLTFRGVTQEVDRTVEGVTKAVTALGQMNKVAGSTEAISKTLSGQVSNLGDSWDQLLNTIGRGNEGILSRAITLLADGIELANKALKSSSQLFEEQQSAILSSQIENFKEFAKTFKTLDEALVAYNAEIDKNIDRINKESEAAAKLANQKATILDNIKGTRQQIDQEKKAGHEKLKLLNDEWSVYKYDVIPALQEYIKTLKEKDAVDQGNKNSEERIKRLKREADESKRIGDAINQYLADQSDLDLFQTKSILSEKKEQRDKDFEDEQKRLKDLEELNKEAAENTRKHWKESYEKRKKDADEAAERQKQLEREIAQLTEQLVRDIVDLSLTTRNDDIQNISDYYDKQIELAGDNDRAKKELEIKRERELDKARERQKEADKRAAKTKILIDGLIAIGKIFAEFGWPAGIIPAAIMGGITTVNVAQVSKYKDGVIDLKGPGTKTSDSIPSMLSKGESVMTADETQSSMSILKSIRARKLNDKVLKEITSGRSGGYTGSSVDITPIVKGLKDLKDSQPDIVLRSNMVYEGRKRGDSYKQWIRSKSMGS